MQLRLFISTALYICCGHDLLFEGHVIIITIKPLSGWPIPTPHCFFSTTWIKHGWCNLRHHRWQSLCFNQFLLEQPALFIWCILCWFLCTHAYLIFFLSCSGTLLFAHCYCLWFGQLNDFTESLKLCCFSSLSEFKLFFFYRNSVYLSINNPLSMKYHPKLLLAASWHYNLNRIRYDSSELSSACIIPLRCSSSSKTINRFWL